MPLIRPPIQLLTAFEAASRLGSFKRAAQELHITPSALSQSIHRLEATLGRALFDRHPRKVELTDAGRSFQRLAQDVVRTYASGFEQFARSFERPVVRVSMIGFIAYEVVLPALHDFHREHPDVEIRIDTGERVVDFRTEPVDAAIRLGQGSWPGTRAWPLDTLQATLVCSPALLRKRPLRSLSDLRHHRLLVPRSTHDDWKRAAQALGLDELPAKNRLVLDSYLGSMVAAEQGLGIAIALFPLTEAWLTRGRLVTPIPERQPVRERHYFVVPLGREKEPHVATVRRWIRKRFDALRST